MKTKIPKITMNQMHFMKSIKQKEIVEANDVMVEIQPYMFPPKSPFSYSTRVLLDNIDVAGKRILEIGIGCGIISIVAAKQGAFVDGVDILPECVKFSIDNAVRNKVFDRIRFYYSNMFSRVEGKI